MKSLAIKQTLASAAVLGMFALAGAVVLALTWQYTHARIKENERRHLLHTLHELVPSSAHDNDLYDDTIQVANPELLGTPDPATVFRAYKNGEPVAALFTVVAPDGYGGPIRLLVGIRYDGALAGVRVISHKETPGLGDKIELGRSRWITGFAGKSLHNPEPGKWAVKKDGGDFDQFTGATVTPRAVVNAVKNALLFFEQHREELFARHE